MLIDTHVHLNNPKLEANLKSILAKAKAKNVRAMIVVGYDNETNKKAIEIAEQYPNIYASVGYHPTNANTVTQDDMTNLDALLNHPKVVAVGECGLDFYWDKEHVDQQIDIFKQQIELAQAHELPIVIHMREATEKTFETLKPYAPVKGVMHCYSGSKEMAHQFIALGMHVSLGGPVTFLNAKIPKEVAKEIPLESLLIETDAPYLAPHPFRGKQNDPSLLPLIAEAIAKERDIPLTMVEDITTKNAIELFKIKEETL